MVNLSPKKKKEELSDFGTSANDEWNIFSSTIDDEWNPQLFCGHVLYITKTYFWNKDSVQFLDCFKLF